jgi:ADP-ribosylglycohydrolase
MLGAITGDVIGSIYEHHNIKRTDFPLFGPRCRFTDDTVMTVAVADAILTGTDYGAKLREWYRLYPERGYGSDFRRWAASETMPQGYSMGNGSAMRVSPVGFAFDSLRKVLEEARKSAEPSHSHPEGIKGAQAVASAVFLARTGSDKAQIKEHIEAWIAWHFNTRSNKKLPTRATLLGHQKAASDGYNDLWEARWRQHYSNRWGIHFQN